MSAQIQTPCAMTLKQAIRSRRSVRGYLTREVPQATLNEVFELAQWAPSNCNVQPWIPHVVSGAALQRLCAALVTAAAADQPIEPDWPADGVYPGVYRQRQVQAARALYGAMGVERNDLEGRRRAYLRNQACFGAPHAVFVFMQRPFDAREVTDLGIYAQTLMLSLTARGIGSCAQGALGLYPPIVRRNLGLADDHRLMFGIAFGYEDPADPANAARVGREPLDQAAHFHR
jgi:nitroreductase